MFEVLHEERDEGVERFSAVSTGQGLQLIRGVLTDLLQRSKRTLLRGFVRTLQELINLISKLPGFQHKTTINRVTNLALGKSLTAYHGTEMLEQTGPVF